MFSLLLMFVVWVVLLICCCLFVNFHRSGLCSMRWVCVDALVNLCFCLGLRLCFFIACMPMYGFVDIPHFLGKPNFQHES